MKPQSRRDFIGKSACGTLAGATSALSADFIPAQSAIAASAKSVIYIFLGGGCSHLDTFDVKPHRPEVQGPTQVIDTVVDGLQFGEHLQQCAKLADRMTVVNSMKTTQGAHEQGVYMMHTSYQMRSTLRHPSLGSWTSKILGPRLDSLPASVLIHGPSNLANSGYFDPIYAPLRIPEASKGLPDLGNPKIIAQTESNLTRLDRFNRRFLEKFKHDKLQAYEEMYDHALALMKGSHVDVFDIHKEKDVVKERYGHHQIGEGCLLARRLVEKGVRHVEVVERGWDTHQDNFGKLSGKLPQVDQAVSALLVDLEQRGLLDDTLVVLATEFGRSPKINDRELGRDHHPSAYSTLLAGGGIRGGVVYGQTDERGHDVVEKPVRPQDLNATIAHALGLPTERRIFNADGRPFRVAHDGEVKSEWFS